MEFRHLNLGIRAGGISVSNANPFSISLANKSCILLRLYRLLNNRLKNVTFSMSVEVHGHRLLYLQLVSMNNDWLWPFWINIWLGKVSVMFCSFQRLDNTAGKRYHKLSAFITFEWVKYIIILDVATVCGQSISRGYNVYCEFINVTGGLAKYSTCYIPMIKICEIYIECS